MTTSRVPASLPRVIRRNGSPVCSRCGHVPTVSDNDLWVCPEHGALYVMHHDDLPPHACDDTPGRSG